MIATIMDACKKFWRVPPACGTLLDPQHLSQTAEAFEKIHLGSYE